MTSPSDVPPIPVHGLTFAGSPQAEAEKFLATARAKCAQSAESFAQRSARRTEERFWIGCRVRDRDRVLEMHQPSTWFVVPCCSLIQGVGCHTRPTPKRENRFGLPGADSCDESAGGTGARAGMGSAMAEHGGSTTTWLNMAEPLKSLGWMFLQDL